MHPTLLMALDKALNAAVTKAPQTAHRSVTVERIDVNVHFDVENTL